LFISVKDGMIWAMTDRDRHEPTPADLEAVELLSPKPGMTAVEYAGVVIEQDGFWNAYTELPPSLFARIVRVRFQDLIAIQPVEDIALAKDRLVKYTKDLQKGSPTYDDSDDYRSSISWRRKVREMTGYNPKLGVRTRTYAQQSEAQSYSSERFWQEVYNETSVATRVAEATMLYALGDKIEEKDPEILADLNERLATERVTDVFTTRTFKAADRLVRVGYDSFSMLIREAAQSGWKNAVYLRDRIEKLPKRDLPHHAVLIHIGNEVTDVLNKNGVLDEGAQLDRLNPRDVAHAAEAVNRCTHLMFDFGQTPPGHDPLNYQLSSQIYGYFFIEANRMLHDVDTR